MDVKDFISSGIIEIYLLGIATEQEVSLVNEMNKKYPEVEEEIIRIEDTLIKLAELGKPRLNTEIKTNVLYAIHTKEQIKLEQTDSTKIIALSAGKTNVIRNYQYGIAAAIGLLIISSVLNVLFFNRTGKMNDEISRLNMEMKSQNESINTMNNQLAVLMDPASKGIVMNGLDISPSSLAKVIWNKKSGEVYLIVKELPPPPTNMQYQLWAIVDGKPVDAGMIDILTPNQLHQMKNISSPEAFAITLEKKGGSPIPTMDAMYMIGNI